MPSVPISAATPFVANDDSQVPGTSPYVANSLGSLHDWITTDIEIKVGSKVSDETLDGIHGVIKEVDHATEKVTVKLYNGVTSTLSAECLELVPPERRDHVKIVGGEYRNLLGVLISVDGSDGVVKLSEGSEIKVLSMSILAKHKP
jgi:transcription elongation factor SPT5